MKSLRFRIPVAVLSILLLGLILGMYLVAQQFERGLLIEFEYQSALLADSLATNITSTTDLEATRLQSIVDRLTQGRETSLEVNIILLNGDASEIAVSNLQDNVGPTSADEHQQLQETLANGVTVSTIGIDKPSAQMPDDTPITNIGAQIPKNQRYLTLQVPLYIEGDAAGSINLKLSLATLDEQLGEVRVAMIFLIVSISSGIGLLITGLLDRIILNPLSRLADGMRDIANNHYERRLDENREDELGQVAETFNTMAQGIETYRNELNTINHSLEQRVRERTTELVELNSTLEQRVEERSGEVLKMNARLRRTHEFTRGTLNQMSESVRLGSSEVELLGYLKQMQFEFDQLDEPSQ